MTPIRIYETAKPVGSGFEGDQNFFLSEEAALDTGHELYSFGAGLPVHHIGLLDPETGRYFLLKSEHAVGLYGSRPGMEDLKKRALAKLTKLERVALGLEVDDAQA